MRFSSTCTTVGALRGVEGLRRGAWSDGDLAIPGVCLRRLDGTTLTDNPQELNYYDRHGNPIISEARGKFAGYKVPQFSIHRGELQLMLLEAVKERLGGEHVHLNHALESFEHLKGEQVKLKFVQKRSGKKATIPEAIADLCVAADGINSTVRRIIYPDEGPPNFSGRMLWRGCVERKPFLTGGSMIWSGHVSRIPVCKK